MSRRIKPHRPAVVLRDNRGVVFEGTDVRFTMERSGFLRRRQFECAYLLQPSGEWVRIGPIREMMFR